MRSRRGRARGAHPTRHTCGAHRCAGARRVDGLRSGARTESACRREHANRCFAVAFDVGVLTPADNFAGRGTTRFGVGETINLSFLSLPPRPATDFGGLDWVVASGGGTITAPVTPHDGTGTYTGPATAGAVTLELRVAGGATAGRVVSTHAITIAVPSKVRMIHVPGSAPNFSPSGPIQPAGGERDSRPTSSSIRRTSPSAASSSPKARRRPS